MYKIQLSKTWTSAWRWTLWGGQVFRWRNPTCSCGIRGPDNESSSHIQMWELDHNESWAPKNQCFSTVVLEKTLESPLDCKEIQPVHPKGDQPWIVIRGTDTEAETPVLWPPHAKSWLTGKDPDAGRDWRQEEKGTTEDEMAGWHHWLNGHEFEQALGDSEGHGSLVCCSPWDRKQDTTEWLNNNKSKLITSGYKSMSVQL